MKKIYRTTLLGLVFIFCFASLSWASIYTFMPTDPTVYNLSHGSYYTWGLDWDLPDGENITGASLSFSQIYNWNSSDNVLYVHLLDVAASGLAVATDNNTTDDFAGQGLDLFKWVNLPDSPQNLTYTFTTAELGMLAAYLGDGNFGFGLDPDCHFYNKGITFTLETNAVPIPGAVWLLGSGLLGLVTIRRRRVKGCD